MRKPYNLIKCFLFAILLVLTSAYRCLSQQHIEVFDYNNQREITANNSITLKPGFHVPAGADFHAHISVNPGINIGTKLNRKMNGVVSYSARVPGLIDLTDTLNGVNQVEVDVQTMDHFGRLKENLKVRSAPSFNHIATFYEYDGAGNEPKKYLPSVLPGETGSFHSLGYSPVYTGYYNAPLGQDLTPSIGKTGNPYTEIRFDNSPLNRVEEVSSPGDDFKMSLGHTIKTKLVSGAYPAAKYIARNDSLLRAESWAGLYNSNYLYGTRTEDENTINQNGATYEYKDWSGKVILKRVSSQDNNYQITNLSTYYVYDERENLCFVLTPRMNPDSADQYMWASLDYQYRYDDMNRMIAKDLPGKDWEYMVYNKANQVVMTQDILQRAKVNQEWTYIKYDALGRVISTGIYTDANAGQYTDRRPAMQSLVNAQSKEWESKTNTGNGYTTNTFPSSSVTLTSINYYDDYNFPGGNPYPYSGKEVSQMTRGMLTGNKINVLGTSDMLWSVNYYDVDGKTIKTFKEHYKGNSPGAGNYDEISTTYDFNGAVMKGIRSHKVGGTEQLRVINEYSYDHRGRKINSWETINNQSRILLSQNVYDDLGNVYKKKLHSSDEGLSFLQTITYSYNARGWLLRAQAEKLDLELRYNNPVNGSTPHYNGNISEFEYKGPNSGNRSFKYGYDIYNQLLKSDYSNAGLLNEEMTYDKVGNILTLKRGPSSNATTQYQYWGSNKLSSIRGALTGDFDYDYNGNMVTDGMRGATLTYNRLNLPATVTKGAQSASYLYDASGIKLRSVQGGTNPTTREYIGGIQYTNNVLEFIATSEGRAVRNPITGIYKYEYNLKDHLGNVRVTIDKFNDTARVIQEDEYYAFGLTAPKYLSGDKNNYLYNGKELQEVLNDQYDYGARFYDPVIARWNVVDPLAEKMRRHSPYSYAFNNPIRYIDRDGMMPTCEGCPLPIWVQAALSKDFSEKSRRAADAGAQILSGQLGFGLGLGLEGKVGGFKASARIGGGAEIGLTSGGVTLQGNLIGFNAGAEYGPLGGDLISASVGNFELGYNKGDPSNPFSSKGNGLSFDVLKEVSASSQTADGKSSVGASISAEGEVGFSATVGVVTMGAKANLDKLAEYIRSSAEATQAFFKSFFDITTHPGQSLVPNNVKRN